MIKIESKEIRVAILNDLLKCSYCGFCEWVCPVLNVKNGFRPYGPRGRVSLMFTVLRENIWSDIVLDSIYTCLLCKACTYECPAGIEIERDIRLFRYLIRVGNFRR